MIELYEAVVDEILDADAQQDLRLRAGELARTMLEDEERSIVHYRAALESVGDDRRAMVALEGLYEETEQSAELKEILQLRCESAGEDEERVQLLHRIAELQSGPLEQPDEAIESYEQLIDIALDDDAVLALEKLYQTHERYEDLCSLYERELDADTGDGSAAIRVKLARICAEQLADTGRALDELAEALSAEPRHEEAVKILEQLLDRVEDPEQRSQVAELLEPVYLRQADWQRLKGVLEARLDTGQDPTERDDLLRRYAPKSAVARLRLVVTSTSDV